MEMEEEKAPKKEDYIFGGFLKVTGYESVIERGQEEVPLGIRRALKYYASDKDIEVEKTREEILQGNLFTKKDVSNMSGFMPADATVRADKICVVDDKIVIFEVKQKLTCGAMGQALAYRDFFVEDYPAIDKSNVGAAIICEESNHVVESLCEDFGIDVFEMRSYNEYVPYEDRYPRK